jgi:hypothetical protein
MGVMFIIGEPNADVGGVARADLAAELKQAGRKYARQQCLQSCRTQCARQYCGAGKGRDRE